MTEQSCTDCRRLKVTATTGRVRYCADGNWRCLTHRRIWLDAQGVGQPALPAPPSAGNQAAMGL